MANETNIIEVQLDIGEAITNTKTKDRGRFCVLAVKGIQLHIVINKEIMKIGKQFCTLVDEPRQKAAFFFRSIDCGFCTLEMIAQYGILAFLLAGYGLF